MLFYSNSDMSNMNALEVRTGRPWIWKLKKKTVIIMILDAERKEKELRIFEKCEG